MPKPNEKPDSQQLNYRVVQSSEGFVGQVLNRRGDIILETSRRYTTDYLAQKGLIQAVNTIKLDRNPINPEHAPLSRVRKQS